MRRKRTIAGAAVLMVVLVGAAWLTVAGEIASDEEVIFFPTTAHFDEQADEWVVPIHIWVFEPERDSRSRDMLIAAVIDALDLDEDELDSELARERLAWFVVDNERGKRPRIVIAGREVALPATQPNGRAATTLRLPAAAVQPDDDGWLAFQLADDEVDDGRTFTGRVQLVKGEGVSVISDIDDTIKVSHVAQRDELIAQTFARPYEAVEGMSALYQQWAEQGARFHYVSAAPWQLYEPYSRFIADAGFPAGDMHMRSFRLKDRTFLSLFADPLEYKVGVIAAIVEQHPQRQFILVGDAGELDPEVYGQIARRFPDRIAHIAIRKVSDADDAPRYAEAFRDLSRDKWTVFADPATVQALPTMNEPAAP